MKTVYLTLAVAGAVIPYLFFLEHFATAGLDPIAFVASGFANPGAAGLTADLLLASLAFCVYVEGRRAAFLIPITLLVGLSCALPLYLYLRARDAAATSARPAAASA